MYCFEAGDERTYLLGSADLMPRNLDHRIEVVMPIEDTHVRNELEAILKALLADNTQSWELAPDGVWHRVVPKKAERRRHAQVSFMRRRERARRIARSHWTVYGVATMSTCPSGSSTSVRTPSACSSRRRPHDPLGTGHAPPRRRHRAPRRDSNGKVALTAAVVGQFVRDAHSAERPPSRCSLRARTPGGDGQELAHVLQQISGCPVRILTSTEGTLRSSGDLLPARPEAARSPSSTWEAAPRRSSSARERQVRPGRSRSTSARSG